MEEADPKFTSSILRDDARTAYASELDVIRHHVVWTNNALHVLEQLTQFPFELFHYQNHVCWSLLMWSMYEGATLGLTRLLADPSKGVLTLDRFASTVEASIALPTERTRFREAVSRVKARHGVADLLETLKSQRDNLVAHLNRVAATQGGEGAGVERVALEDLQRACRFMNELFQVLAFDAHYGFLFGEYDPETTWPEGAQHRSDIERVLDWLARESPILQMPEQQPVFWPRCRTQLSAEELRILNWWRLRLGLPAA